MDFFLLHLIYIAGNQILIEYSMHPLFYMHNFRKNKNIFYKKFYEDVFKKN